MELHSQFWSKRVEKSSCNSLANMCILVRRVAFIRAGGKEDFEYLRYRSKMVGNIERKNFLWYNLL